MGWRGERSPPATRAWSRAVRKPSSVPGGVAANPWTVIHLGTPLPTHSSGLPGRHGGGQPHETPLYGLAPSGVYLADPVARTAGALLPHPFTFTSRSKTRCTSATDTFDRAQGASCGLKATSRLPAFCGTFLRLPPTGSYPALCPVELGLSSRRSRRRRPATAWTAVPDHKTVLP